MQFLFFNAAGRRLFVREDAEEAQWVHEELTLTAVFPYKADKVIQRGMRVCFTDCRGDFQAFEIGKVQNYEPDHRQQIIAEHIVIAELTNEHFAGATLTAKTAQEALTTVLSGTWWSVGTVTASGTSSAELGITSVWETIRTIEENWNVYIVPRLTASSSITRKLDIIPAGSTWRGIRLALDKNADEIGVTYDDTETVTALYGYGRSTGTAGSTPEPLTFADVVWTQTASHPAKPSGQKYIEDPAATALYGRNGRPRYGFYQNGQIENAETLLEKTWEVLQTCNAPEITIECQVRDLYRLGYADQPMRLHDEALADVSPIGVTEHLEIIRMTENLLDPTATQVTMGKYIPNIVYIDLENGKNASGGGGKGISGRRGGKGSGSQTNTQKELQEFYTQIAVNQYEISLRATQVDLDNTNEILREAGITITAGGVWAFSTDRTTGLGAELGVKSDQIALVVKSDGSGGWAVNEASIVAAVNAAGSTVAINADKILLNGTTLVSDLLTGTAVAAGMQITQLYVTNAQVLTNLQINNNANIKYQGDTMAWKTQTVVTGVTTNAQGAVTNVATTTLSYMGKA